MYCIGSSTFKVYNQFLYDSFETVISCWSKSTHIELPTSTRTIWHNAFYGCTFLQSILIPNSIKRIGEAAFKGCTSLQSINLPKNIEDIGRGTFEGCLSLKEIHIPNGTKELMLRTIGEAYYNKIIEE